MIFVSSDQLKQFVVFQIGIKSQQVFLLCTLLRHEYFLFLNFHVIIDSYPCA